MTVIPSCFGLAHFSAHDLIAGFGVAHNVDSANISASGGIGHQNQLHAIVFAINFRARFGACKRKAKISKEIVECLGCFHHIIDVVGLTYFDVDQGFEFVVFVEVIAFQRHLRNNEHIAFCDVDGDGNVLFVRRNSHLRGVNSELQKSAGLVPRAQCFQIGIELGARVTV